MKESWLKCVEWYWVFAVFVMFILSVSVLADKYMTNQRDVECAKAGLVQKFIPDDRFGHQPTVIWVRPDEPAKAEQK